MTRASAERGAKRRRQQSPGQLSFWDRQDKWGTTKSNKHKAALKCALSSFSKETILGYLNQGGVYGLYYLLSTHSWSWLPAQGCWSKKSTFIEYAPIGGVA